MNLIWSPYPREMYTIEMPTLRPPEYKARLGIGVHPVFETPGVWNIWWLSCDRADELIAWSGPVSGFPVYSGLIPACIGMAWEPAGLGLQAPTYLGELADKVPPAEFLKVVSQHPRRDTLILPQLFKQDWWKIVHDRAAMYNAAAPRLLHVPANEWVTQ